MPANPLRERDLFAFAKSGDGTSLNVFAVAEDPLWMGSPSPPVRIDYTVSCEDAVSTAKRASTRKSLLFGNGSTQALSQPFAAPACATYHVFATSRISSTPGDFAPLIRCGKTGPSQCFNEVGSTTRLLGAYATRGNGNFTLALLPNDFVWEGAGSAAYPIDYETVCE
jgi:hypothetical protein